MGGAFTPCVFEKALQEDLSQERKIQVPKFNFPHFLPHRNPKLFSCHFPSHCIILCLAFSAIIPHLLSSLHYFSLCSWGKKLEHWHLNYNYLSSLSLCLLKTVFAVYYNADSAPQSQTFSLSGKGETVAFLMVLLQSKC